MNLNNLYKLQNTDTQINSIKNEMIEIEKELKKNKAILQAEEHKNSIEVKLQASQKSLKKILDDIERKKIKLSQSDATLYSGKVKNPKELEDLQQEIQSIKKVIAKLEDSQLELMLTQDTIQTELENAQHDLNSIASAFETKKSQLVARNNKLTQMLEFQEKQRTVILASISKELLDRYENLLQKKNGLAIVTLENDACSACGTQLTPSQKQAVRSSSTLFTCPTCGRILYVK